MTILDIISKSIKPELYDRGTSFMWNDDYISKQLLKIHLNPEMDLGSRKLETIRSTADWILKLHPQNKKLNILDLGCGPGLYTEIFAQHGHQVTGVDISRNSIDYARKEASGKKLDITYINADYLELEFPNHSFDLVTLIYTDLGVLLPAERDQLIYFVNQILKKGGMFIFDVLKDNNMEDKATLKSWEVSHGGFWRSSPYLALSESFLYKDEKVILYQHIILEEEKKAETYRFWTHFFSQSDLEKMLIKNRFHSFSFYHNILPVGGMWNGDNVIFCTTIKE